MTLNNVNIIITRPKYQATGLANIITQEGGHPILFPTIAIKDAHQQDIAIKNIQKIEQCDLAIFTSPNAVHKAMSYWPTGLTKLKIAALGSTTKKTLEAYGIYVNFLPDTFNSEKLLALPELQTIINQTIAIITGEGGRDLLAPTLESRGAHVVKIEIYRRTCPTVAAQEQLTHWRQHGVDIIICTSGESLTNLVTLISKIDNPWLLKQQLLVVSPRIAEIATQLGFAKAPIIAENATNKAITQALQSET